jgi:hypothetical protein
VLSNSVIEKLNIVKDLNNIFESHQIPLGLKFEDLTITENTVSDSTHGTSLLSDAIINNIWGNIRSAEVFHYTNKIKTESILSSGKFRLYNLSKRFGEGEINTFCISHDLQGYLEKDDEGTPTYKKLLMNDMYTASFSGVEKNSQEEKYLKNEFASYQGVRLKLKVTAANQDFRKIVYEKNEGKPLSLLNEITTAVKTKYGRSFILNGISRLCAFYLSSSFKLENEYRILFKYQQSCGVDIKNDGTHNYVELPLNTMNSTGYMIEILEIETNESLTIPDNFKCNLKQW